MTPWKRLLTGQLKSHYSDIKELVSQWAVWPLSAKLTFWAVFCYRIWDFWEGVSELTILKLHKFCGESVVWWISRLYIPYDRFTFWRTIWIPSVGNWNKWQLFPQKCKYTVENCLYITTNIVIIDIVHLWEEAFPDAAAASAAEENQGSGDPGMWSCSEQQAGLWGAEGACKAVSASYL